MECYEELTVEERDQTIDREDWGSLSIEDMKPHKESESDKEGNI